LNDKADGVEVFQLTPFLIPLLLAALISAGVAAYAWRRRATRGAAAFVLLMACVAVWSFGYALELAGADLPTKLFWARLQYFGVVGVTFMWLVFALQYTRRERWLTLPRIVLGALIPMITLLLVLTNEAHGLIWPAVGLEATGSFLALTVSHGLWFWIHFVYSYLLLLLGTALIILALTQLHGLYRSQALALLAGALAPWLGNVFYFLELSPIPQLDLTPFVFTFSGALWAYGIFRYQLLDLAPVARNTVVESMSDGMLVIDMERRIVDANLAAARFLDASPKELIGRTTTEVFGSWPHLLERYRDVSEAQDEISLGEGEARRHYSVRISPIADDRGRITARLLVVRDITASKLVELELRRMAERQTTLYEVLRDIGEQPDPESVARVAVEAIARHTHHHEVVISLPSADRQSWMTYSAQPSASLEGKVHPIHQGVTGRAFRSGRTQYVPDVSVDADYVLVNPSAQSELAVPLLHGARVVGVLNLESDQQAGFSPDDISLAESLADAVALALDNARLYAETRQYLGDLSALFLITQTTGESLLIEEVLARALDSTLVALKFDVGVVMLADAASGALHPAVEHGATDIIADLLEPLQQLSERPYRRRAVFMLFMPDDLRQDAPKGGEALLAQGLQNFVGIPLNYRERCFGVMCLLSRQPVVAASVQPALLYAVGRQIATAIANARLYRVIAEEQSRLKALLKASRDGLILIGMDRRVLVVNRPTLRLLNLPGDPDDWEGRPLSEALSHLRHYAPKVVLETVREMRRVEHGDEPSGQGEYEVNSRQIRWINLPVLADNDQFPLGRLIVLNDVTEERALSKLRDDLTDTMIHDLRNPVTAILGAIDVFHIAYQLSNDELKLLDVIERNSRRLLALINKILDITRLENGEMPLDRTVILLGEILAEVMQLQTPLAQEKQLQLRNEISDDLPAVWVDPDLIGRVLQNLIGNAINFTPIGGTIQVTSALETSGSGSGRKPEVVICVSDTGPGISPEVRERLFQKFVSGQEFGHGSGLGLAFCKLAVEAHGGRIWVDDKAGQGTKIRFTLPVAPTSDPDGNIFMPEQLAFA
jgi:PAS domain S-box-containing protein